MRPSIFGAAIKTSVGGAGTNTLDLGYIAALLRCEVGSALPKALSFSHGRQQQAQSILVTAEKTYWLDERSASHERRESESAGEVLKFFSPRWT